MSIETIPTTTPRRPGFSRPRRSWQYAAAEAGIHRLKPGLPDGLSRVCAQNER